MPCSLALMPSRTNEGDLFRINLKDLPSLIVTHPHTGRVWYLAQIAL